MNETTSSTERDEAYKTTINVEASRRFEDNRARQASHYVEDNRYHEASRQDRTVGMSNGGNGKLRKRRRRRKGRDRWSEPHRQIGFHCAWCRKSAPYNERFAPNYYRAAEGHRHDPWMCYACHLETAGNPERRRNPRARKPRLVPETLEQFWMEDVSDEPYVEAASSYFRVTEAEITKVMQRITV